MSLIGRLLGYDYPDADTIARANTQQIQNDTPKGEPDVIGAVLFQLTEQGDMNVKVEWGDTQFTEGRANIFGEFLHHICTGTFKETVKQVIYQIAMNDVSHRDFVKKTLEAWRNKEIDHADDNDDPIVSPLSVFNLTQSSAPKAE